MIANFVTILIGLWLAYRAIFSIPAGDMNQTEMMVAGIAVILLALWARRTDFMGWHSGTSIFLGLIILILAAVHRAIGVEPLVSFWMILLIGITVAIVAMWSMLYRPDTAQPAESH
jgi:cadmium resistance protein CadD (predicted permease)